MLTDREKEKAPFEFLRYWERQRLDNEHIRQEIRVAGYDPDDLAVEEGVLVLRLLDMSNEELQELRQQKEVAPLDDDPDDEAIRQGLRDFGYDPDEVAAEGRAFVEGLLSKARAKLRESVSQEQEPTEREAGEMRGPASATRTAKRLPT